QGQRGARGADPRAARAGRAGYLGASAGAARLRHRVPVLCAIPEPHRGAEHRLRAREHPREQERRRGSRPGAARAGGAARPGLEVPGAALGRTAAPARPRPRPPAGPPPGLVLPGEPLSALDAKVRVYLRQEIKRLQRRLGVTTIMVTHDQEEALTMADRIVVMNRGRIGQIGTPLQVYREPASPFVADFIGAMNFLPGTVARPGAVRLGAVDLACDADGPPPGTAVTLAIRPQDIAA